MCLTTFLVAKESILFYCITSFCAVSYLLLFLYIVVAVSNNAEEIYGHWKWLDENLLPTLGSYSIILLLVLLWLKSEINVEQLLLF